MAQAHTDALKQQHAPEHASTHKGVLQVQLVDSAHERQISIADEPRPVIDRATADIEQLGLTRHAQWMFTVDHAKALSNPALVSAPFQKIVLQGQLPDLGVQRRQIHRLRRRATAEHVGCTFQQLPLPIVDLCGVELKLLAQLGHGPWP